MKVATPAAADVLCVCVYVWFLAGGSADLHGGDGYFTQRFLQESTQTAQWIS